MRPWQTIQETNHNTENQYFSCCVLQVDAVSVKQQLHISHKMPESEQICDHSLMNCLFLYMLQVISHMQSFMYMSVFFSFCFLSIFRLTVYFDTAENTVMFLVYNIFSCSIDIKWRNELKFLPIFCNR